MLARPALRSRLSCARRVRISFARCSASIRWTRDRSGAAECLEGEFVAGGMGGDYTRPARASKPLAVKMPPPLLEVQRDAGRLTLEVRFAAFLTLVTTSSRQRPRAGGARRRADARPPRGRAGGVSRD